MGLQKRRLRSYVPQLQPYLKTVSLYFLMYYSEEVCDAGWCNAIRKVSPIMAIITFLVLHGHVRKKGKQDQGSAYVILLFLGLTFSTIGDICLVWKTHYFLLGIAAFALAHVMYTIAFGFEKSSWRVGLFLCLYGIVFWKFVTRNVRGVMEKAIGIYTCIISFMVWRAISRIEPNSDISNLFTSWNKLCSCAGAILFAFSDCNIAISRFVFRYKGAHHVIMSTYYLAQLGIALSVVDFQTKQRGMNLRRLMKSSATLVQNGERPHVNYASGIGEANTPKYSEESASTIKLENGRSPSGSLSEIRNEGSLSLAMSPSILESEKISTSWQSVADSIRDFDPKPPKSRSLSSLTICTSYSRKRCPKRDDN